MSCLDIFIRNLTQVLSKLEPQSGTGTEPNGSQQKKAPKLTPIDGIKVLSQEGQNVCAKVDIVAIHGLGGHAEGTWTNPRNGVFWIREFLVPDITDARVMTFGYDSHIFSKNISDIPQFAEKLLGELLTKRGSPAEQNRPLLFICHSLGGIIFKKALILAHERRMHYGDILTSTSGVIFMGTPHNGSEFAKSASILGVLDVFANAGPVGWAVRKNLVKNLKKNSQVLADISESFIERGTNLKIVSFWEACSMPRFTIPVVDRSSATLHRDNEIIWSINADHRNMCKFGEKGNDYNNVLSELVKLCDHATNEHNIETRKEQIETHNGVMTREQVLEILRGTGTEIDLDEVTELCDGTCMWVLQDPDYNRWDTSSSPTGLWLSGDPGTGKTVMSGFIIDTLKKRETAGCHPVYVSIFCRQDRPINLLIILRSILYQFLLQDRTLWGVLYQAQNTVQSANGMFRALAKMMLARRDTLFLFIDGVDELADIDQKQLLEGLRKLMDTATSEITMFNERGARLKILISSRPHNDIGRYVRYMSQLSLTDNRQHVVHDIRRFTRDNIKEFLDVNSAALDQQLTKEIEDAIVDGSGQMFQWASLAWATFLGTERHWERSALRTDKVREQLELLKSLPPDLNDLYRKILQKIPHHYSDDAERIFKCLLAAVRPLKVSELTTILSMMDANGWCKSAKDAASNAQGIKWEDRIQLSCGPLVSIKKDTTIRLIHHTVREFLNLQTSSRGVEWKDEAHDHIAIICIRYLSFEEFSIGPLKVPPSDTMEAIFQLQCEGGFRTAVTKFPFLEYASVNWSHHIANVSKPEDIHQIFMHFTACSQQMNLAFQIFWFSEGCGGAFPRNITPLDIVCYYGLHTLIPLTMQNDLRKADNYGRTPLFWAVLNGHSDTVRMLLPESESFNLDSLGVSTFSPLHLAADRGHSNLVGLFLDTGADPNSIDEEFGTPLQAAAIHGHSDVVGLLLGRGAKVNAEAGTLGTALQAAAYHGHHKLVEFLLDAGADPNIQTNESTFQNALQAALGQPLVTRVARTEDHENEMLLHLLNHNADVNATGGLYGDALQAAATHGKLEAVKLLLARGAMADNGGGNLGGALQAAANGGHYPVVVLLLEAKKDRAQIGSARRIAVQNGHEKVVLALDNTMKPDLDRRDSCPAESSLEPTKRHVKAMDKVLKLGVRTFKMLVKGGRKTEADVIVRSMEKTFETSIRDRDRVLAHLISTAGAGALQAMLEIPDDRMIRKLVELGLSVLQIAIREYDGAKEESAKKKAKAITEDMSGIWIDALELGMKGKGRSVVETVMDNTATRFKGVLDEADEMSVDGGREIEVAERRKNAEHLSHAAVQLLLAAVQKEKQEMIECLASVVTKGLGRALEGNRNDRRKLVKTLVKARAAEFRDALSRGQNTEAKALSKAGLATLLAAVELKNESLVETISSIWATELQAALEQDYSIVIAIVSERASDFEKAVGERREAATQNRWDDMYKAKDKVEALSDAGLAILLAAFRKGCSELAGSMSETWVKVLHSAEMNTIEIIVTDRAKAFNKAIDRTLEDDKEPTTSLELSHRKAFKEAESLSEVGFALLLASIQIDLPQLTETISRIWVGALNSAVAGKRSQLVRRVVENRAAVFKEAVDARNESKLKLLLKVAVSLSEAAAAEKEMGQLSRILTEIWLSALNSAIDGKYLEIIRNVVKGKATEFNTAIKCGDTKAVTILSIGLELLFSSITCANGSRKFVDLTSGIWAEAMQQAASEDRELPEKLQEVKVRLVQAARGRGETEEATREAGAALGLVLMLAAAEQAMEELMDILIHIFELDGGVEGGYSCLIQSVAESKRRKFSYLAKGDEKEKRVIGAVINGKYGLAMQELVEHAMRSRGIGRNRLRAK